MNIVVSAPVKQPVEPLIYAHPSHKWNAYGIYHICLEHLVPTAAHAKDFFCNLAHEALCVLLAG